MIPKEIVSYQHQHLQQQHKMAFGVYIRRYLVTLRVLFIGFMPLLFLGCVALPSESTNEKIVFSTNGTIQVMNPDGSEQRVFLERDLVGLEPTWSPDGQKIAFSSVDARGKMSIWIADANGHNPYPISPSFDSVTATWLNPNILLTDVVTDTGQLSENPTSQFILDVRNKNMTGYSNDFATNRPFRSGEQWLSLNTKEGPLLYSLNAEPKTVLHGYTISGPWAFDVPPSGEEVVFSGAPYPNPTPLRSDAIYRAKIDPTGSDEVIKIVEFDGAGVVRWSPDGKWIVLLDRQSRFQIIDANNNTVSKTFQTEFPLIDGRLEWSPDSEWLLASPMNYGTIGVHNIFDLVKINRETGQVTRLTYSDEMESSPDWGVVQK